MLFANTVFLLHLSIDHLMNAELLIIDTETTASGDAPGNEPIQISWKCIGKSAAEEDETFLMCPESPCLPGCSVIHGYSQKDINTFEPIKVALERVWNTLTLYPSDIIVCGYNVDFDISIIHNALKKYLGKAFQPQNRIDVLRLARRLLEEKQLGNFRLDTVYYYLYPHRLSYLQKARQSHNATVDVELTLAILHELWGRAEERNGKVLGIFDLLAFCNAPSILTEWPFGKHKGRLVKDVLEKDSGYVDWFMNKCDFTSSWPDLVHTIKTLEAC